MRPLSLFALVFGILALGCASTTVRKNPGPHDRGVRYNLPKPYLVLQPAKKASADGKTFEYVPNAVDIKIEMLPDYSEEYSIHVRAGVGINKTGITLEEGWKLTQINFDIDSNTTENVNAVSDLITKLPKFGKSGGGTEPSRDDVKVDNVCAFNVPLGYYESVIGEDECGKKRLYGWRYVGFFPFNNCPTAACGAQATDCRAGDVFGLVYEKGVMTFKRLDHISTQDVQGRAKVAKP